MENGHPSPAPVCSPPTPFIYPHPYPHPYPYRNPRVRQFWEPTARLRASGRIKALLFHEAGILQDVNVGAITSLASYRGHAVYAKLGSAVAPTKDLFGWGGAVKLANADAEQLVKDYAVIEALCHSGLWTIE